MVWFKRGVAAVVDRNQRAAFGARLADVASLHVAGKDYPWFFAENLPGVHVAQGPVVVLFGAKAVECAGGVVFVPLATRGAGVQQTDIEHARYGGRIVGRKIRGNCRSSEALAVDRDAQLVEHDRFRFAVREHVDVVGQRQRAGHLVRGVVVAGDYEHANPGLAQLGHLGHEEQPGALVPPVAVVEVAGDEHERGRLVDSQLHQVFHRPPGGLANLLDRSPLVTFEPFQRTIEMNVGSVNELEHAG